MRKLLIGIIIILLLIPSVVSVSVNKTSQSKNGNILYVGGSGPGNYTSIQDAINDASPGDTVFVYKDSSPYKENVRIKKMINLIGEDRDTTIIEGEGIKISSDDSVVVSGFTIINANIHNDNGIETHFNNNLIHNNKIMYWDTGIFILADSNNSITNNIILHNKYDGIFFDISENDRSPITGNVIGDNTVSYWYYGLYLHRRSGYIHHNDFYMNWNGNAKSESGAGIWDDGSEGNYWDDWEDNPGYPDVYIIPSSFGPKAKDFHPSPTPYFNYTIVSIYLRYDGDVNEPIWWFEPKINVDPNSVLWFWDFGDGNTSNEIYPEHAYSKPGIFDISVTVIDSKGQSDIDKSKVYIGDPPHTPIITGPINCTIGKFYNYTVVADDPDGGLLYYDIDWGDWTNEKIGPFPAGEKVNISHCWTYQGTFTIHVWAIDEAEYESDYGTLNVIVPRNKAKSNSFFSQFLERFPLLKQLFYMVQYPDI